MHKRTFIRLVGYGNTGKDSLAAMLQTQRKAQAFAFSDILYNEVQQAYWCDHSLLTQRHTKELPVRELALAHCLNATFVQRMQALYASGTRSPHQLLEWWGTEYRRSQNPHYLINAMQYRIAQCMAPAIIVTDVSHEAEAQMLRALGAQIWRITRPGHEVRTRHPTSVARGLIAHDLLITNNATLEHLWSVGLQCFEDLVAGNGPALADDGQCLFNQRNYAV